MDSEPVYIGSKTNNGKKVQLLNHDNAGQPFQKYSSKPVSMVDVYVDDTFIRQMPLKLVVRFSKVAAAAYPKPEAFNKSEVTGDVKGEEVAHEWAEDDGRDLDVKKLTTEVSQLSTKFPVQKATTKAKGVGTLVTPPSSDSGESAKGGNKKLHLHLGTLWIQPPVSAFEFAFHWMHLAKAARHGDPVLDYAPQQPDVLSLQRLVDLYAAALCLELRPFPHKMRHAVMNRVTTIRPLVDNLTYIHERLPIDDPVMTRTITSYFEHQAGRNNAYTQADLTLIDNYVCEVDEELHRRFRQIGAAREQRFKTHKRGNGEARLQQIAEGGAEETSASHGTVDGASESKGVTEGRRRNRRAQGIEGKGSNGEAVAEMK